MSSNSVRQPCLRKLARTGDLRAIAYWINSFLAPQGVYVRVGVTRLGCLHLLVEFEQQPDRERLVRFLCHRLCQLKSDLISTVRIAARPLGTKRLAWTQSVRLFASTQPSTRPATIPRRPAAAVQPLVFDRALPTSTSLSEQTASRRPGRKNAKRLSSRPIDRAISRKVSVRPFSPAARVRRRQSIALGSAAAVAFTVGCSFEIVRRLNVATSARQARVTEVAQDRATTVATVDDRVVVAQQLTMNPSDPTVTLTFSADAALGNPTLAEAMVSDWASPIIPTVNAPNLPQSDLDSMNRMDAYGQADVVLTTLPATDVSGGIDTNINADTDTNKSDVALNAFSARSVDIVNLATDRLMQSSDSDIGKTLDALEQAGIYPIGVGRNPREARRPEILDVKGQRIAYLGYADSDLQTARSRGASINAAIDSQIAADIQAIRSQVDWIIVNYQWSQNLAEYPGDRQVNLARFAIDNGADLVVGHHADVLQGAEIYKGRAIAYSLGNFIFADSANRNADRDTDYDTALLKVSLRGHQMRLEFLPVQVRSAKPEIVSGEKAQQVLQYIQQASGLFDQPMQSPTVLDVRAPADAVPDPASDPAPTLTPPNSPATPSDSFTTFPTSPAGEAQEINDNASYPEVGVQDSFDRLDTAPTAQPIDFKQQRSQDTEMQKIYPEVQQQNFTPPHPLDLPQPQAAPEIAPEIAPEESGESNPVQQAAPEQADPSQPAAIDTVATLAPASPANSPDQIATVPAAPASGIPTDGTPKADRMKAIANVTPAVNQTLPNILSAAEQSVEAAGESVTELRSN